MEFLKTCNTNAQAIGDFEAVAFIAFSVKRAPTHTSAKPNDWSPSEDIRAVEAELQQQLHLVVHDASRPWLWLFRPTTADVVGQKPPDLPVLEAYHFQREQFGVVKALELARHHPMRSMNVNTPSSGPTNSPSTPGPAKGPQGGSGRFAQGTAQPNQALDQQQSHDVFAVYELFTSAVVALVSYYLVKDHKAIALNYRTFVSKPTIREDSDSGLLSNSAEVPHWLTNVVVYWASSGTLVVSIMSLVKPELRCLDEVATEDMQKQFVGRTIRVGPNGSLAKVVSFDDPLDAATEDVSQRLQRKRVKVGPAEQSIERWKSTVTRWLAWKGYSIPDLDKRISWVRIRVAHATHFMVSSPAPQNQSREMLWPRALCFFFADSTDTGIRNESSQNIVSNHGDNALEWFETQYSTGFNNPIDVAQQWFLGKLDRDKLLEARRRAKKAEEDAARTKEENHGLYPSSPLNSRTGAYGDLQAVSGVYPTPPDGVVPGTILSCSETPSISGAVTNTILVPGGNNPAINLLAPQDSAPVEGQQQPPTSPEFSLPFDQFNSSGGNDDLFEDMDEDGFEGNGVTDADFNFFDEPDDDIDMMDAPTMPGNKPVPTRKAGKEKQTPTIPQPDIKEETSDPLAALEDALATASGHSDETTQSTRMEQQVNEQIPVEPEQKPSSQSYSTRPEIQVTNRVSREPTPPLSPHFIQQTLLPSPKDKSTLQTPKSQVAGPYRDSIFDPVSFNRKMSLSDAKYHDGRFSFLNEKSAKANTEAKGISKPPASLRDIPLLTKLRYAIGLASKKGISEVTSLARADSDYSDSTSETSSILEEEVDDALSIGPEPLSAGFIIPGKRKLPTDGNATPMSATSFAESFGGEGQDITGLQTDEGALASFEPTPWDWSLTNVPAPIELPPTITRYSVPSFSPIVSSMPNTPTSQPDLTMEPPDEKPLSGKDSIAVAQIVTIQLVSATLDVLHEDHSAESEYIPNRVSAETSLHGVIKKIFPEATDCNMLSLVSIQEVYPDPQPQAKGQQRPPPRRPNDSPSSTGYQLLPFSAPYIRVRRSDTLWDLLPPALAFWEPLGLSPCSPAKNIVAFCIYPYSESLRPCVENFLVNVQIAYDNCKLGSHARVETAEFEGGLVPCKIGVPNATRAAFKALRDTSVQLGKLLATKHMQMRSKDDGQKNDGQKNEGQKIDAFVIYMIDPFDNPSAIWELCSAFWALFQAYGQGPPGRPDSIPKPDLVLQIVPIKYIASLEVPVILDSSIYAKLAREVYDRCPPSAPSEDKTPLSIYSAPSFQLEEALTRHIPFKLIAEPAQDLLRENSYLHLGYAISLDGTWITVAWTDSCGKSQAVVSYNLGTRLFGEIAKEIWQTTIEILQARRVTWRVCIAKSGVMEKDEFEAWVFILSIPNQLNLFITLLTVDTNPPLKLTPTVPTKPPTNPPTAQPSTNTPGSTPQAGVSPDPHGLTPAATPSAEPTSDPTTDPDARLVDATDESWGIILSHRLHNSNSTTEFRPCLISGLLVKRGETYSTSSTTHQIPDPERGPLVVGVNILWIGAIQVTKAATSPFPTAGAEGVSPGSAGPSPGLSDRATNSLMWTPTQQTRTTAESLLKEVLTQYRALGLLAKLRGMRGTRHGTVPWHVAAAIRGVRGLEKCV